jgi:putative endonuclease
MTTQAAKTAVGRLGERLAGELLEEQGWRVLERNWRSPDRACPGELDLVALDPDGTVVAVEVRTRRGTACGSALESVTPDKVRRLRRLLAVWWAHRPPGAAPRAGSRVDVVAVQLSPRGEPALQHVRGVA